jgi:hypothetical protein
MDGLSGNGSAGACTAGITRDGDNGRETRSAPYEPSRLSFVKYGAPSIHPLPNPPLEGESWVEGRCYQGYIDGAQY